VNWSQIATGSAIFYAVMVSQIVIPRIKNALNGSEMAFLRSQMVFIEPVAICDRFKHFLRLQYFSNKMLGDNQMSNSLAVSTGIESRIFTIRGVQVMLDRDLAELYGVETRILKRAVNRNIVRFPPHFMFKLSENEMKSMVSQNGIPSKSYFGGSEPYALQNKALRCFLLS
jgi:hypothetical protein